MNFPYSNVARRVIEKRVGKSVEDISILSHEKLDLLCCGTSNPRVVDSKGISYVPSGEINREIDEYFN